MADLQVKLFGISKLSGFSLVGLDDLQLLWVR